MGKPNIYQLIKKPSHKLIEELSKNDVVLRSGRSCPYMYIHERISKGNNPDFKRFLCKIADEKAEILSDIDYVKTLFLFNEKRGDWVRSIDTWKKKSRSKDKQFKDIADHLFVKYDMPLFMYNAWLQTSTTWSLTKEIDWFIDIGKGLNIRTSKNLPFPLTKRMAHIFLQTPSYFTPVEGFMYAKIISMGGDIRTVNGVMGTKLKSRLTEWEFWDSVIRFFINNPMLDTAQYNPIVDYIQYVKYDKQYGFVNGVRAILPPEKPNFSMKDRDPNALVATVNAWHHKLTRYAKKGVPTEWGPMTVNNFSYTTGKDDNKITYEITQLLKSTELNAEGRAHGHCVATYVNSCASGKCGIFSMTSVRFGVPSKILTIEVLKEGSISQIRGKGNRLATGYELDIIKKWADKERLIMSRWIK